ncbi:hypothetical protein HK100_004689 [Physocladia obscura]|uniref:Agd3 CBM87 domain-containing protein n=1 Tax=Physocladia obscura TaxID=109957 RepID=A0AAD5SY48_9FUNG|nr:hypothetical protein HK100_004689 [Physocladia obscura]
MADTILGFATLPLYAGGAGNFTIVVLGSGALGFSDSQWAQLYAYQTAQSVRLVSLYDIPGLGPAAGFTRLAAQIDTGVLSLSAASARFSGGVGLGAGVTVRLDTAAFGTVYAGAVSDAAAVTPVLSIADPPAVAAVAAVVYAFAQREQLSFFYQIAAWDLAAADSAAAIVPSLSAVSNAIWIAWASRGRHSLPVSDFATSGADADPQTTVETVSADSEPTSTADTESPTAAVSSSAATTVGSTAALTLSDSAATTTTTTTASTYSVSVAPVSTATPSVNTNANLYNSGSVAKTASFVLGAIAALALI